MEKIYSNKLINLEHNLMDKDLIEIEIKYNFKFPKEFRKHYLLYNGGELEKYIFIDEDTEEFIVQQFIPIKYNEKGTRVLESILDNLRLGRIIPEWLIPFADEPGGDLYCFSLRELDNGVIYYWSHEYNYGENPEEYVFYISDSLKSFVNSMQSD